MPSPLRAGLAALLLLGSTAARAQTSITLTFPGTTGVVDIQNNGPGTCNNDLFVNWATTGLAATNICNNLQIWVANGTACGTSPGTSATDGGTDLVLGSFPLTIVFSGPSDRVALSTIPGLVGKDCQNGQIDVTNAICASVQIKSGTDGTCSGFTQSNTLKVRYDSIPPDPPSVSLTPQDSKIIVNLGATGSQASDVFSFNVEYARVFDDGGVAPFTLINDINANSGSGQTTIKGLVNENTYLVRGFALDEVDNISGPSATQTGTPQAADGFWATYKKDGGAELGGCNAGAVVVPSVIAALSALAALLRRRR